MCVLSVCAYVYVCVHVTMSVCAFIVVVYAYPSHVALHVPHATTLPPQHALYCAIQALITLIGC